MAMAMAGAGSVFGGGNNVFAVFQSGAGWTYPATVPAPPNAPPYTGCVRAMWIMEGTQTDMSATTRCLPQFGTAPMINFIATDTSQRQYAPNPGGSPFSTESYLMTGTGGAVIVQPNWNFGALTFHPTIAARHFGESLTIAPS